MKISIELKRGAIAKLLNHFNKDSSNQPLGLTCSLKGDQTYATPDSVFCGTSPKLLHGDRL